MMKIYEFTQSNVVTHVGTEHRTLMTGVIIETFSHALAHKYPWYKSMYVYVGMGISLVLTYKGIRVTLGYVW